MTTIQFTVKDEVARRWHRILQVEFANNLGEKVTAASLDDLVKYALFAYMADIAERDSELALKALEESMEGN